jgi:Zn-dependent protease
MFSLKEFIFILFASAILGYVVAFPLVSYANWLELSSLALLVLAINIVVKKLAAFKLGCEVEVKPLTLYRYGFRKSDYFKYGLPAWLIWPVVVVWGSLGRVWWLAVSGFEVFATRSRIGRKFAELTEWDIAVIAAAGITANLIAALVAFIIGHEQFMLISLWFIFFNMLPFPAYDGGKIFFGRWVFWLFMFASSLIVLILLHIAKTTLITTLASIVILVIIAVILNSLFRKE